MAASKENQPDKLEKIKRFEKEKKVMQKKQEGIKKIKTIKVSSKPKKRIKNWIKAYEDGMFEDDNIV